MDVKGLKAMLKWLKNNKIGYFQYADEDMTWEFYDSNNADVPLSALKIDTNEEPDNFQEGRSLPDDEVDEEALKERIRYYSAD